MYRRLWNRDFILLLQSKTVSTIGDLMYSVAIGYWVYQKTGSSGLMGVMSSLSMFITMLLSPFSGSIVDKLSRKRLLVGIDAIQGIIMLTIGILAWLDKLNVPAVLIAAFLAALGSVFYNPAVGTLIVDIIPRDDMVRGQSIFSGMSSLIDMAGTAVSGVLIAFFGVPLIVLLNGLSNLYSALSEWFIRIPRTVQQGAPVSAKSILRDTRNAVKNIISDRFLQLFIPSALAINLLAAGPLMLLLPFCMEKGFTVDMYGYLMAVWSAASLLCVSILGVVKLKPDMRFRILTIGFIASVLFYIPVYLSGDFISVCIWAFLASFANCAGNTIFNSTLMLALPQENRGAILGFIQSASVGGSALSTVIYGLLGDAFPLHLVFTAGAILTLIPMLYLCLHPRTKIFILMPVNVPPSSD